MNKWPSSLVTAKTVRHFYQKAILEMVIPGGNTWVLWQLFIPSQNKWVLQANNVLKYN